MSVITSWIEEVPRTTSAATFRDGERKREGKGWNYVEVDGWICACVDSAWIYRCIDR